MRLLIAIAVATSLFATNLLAAEVAIPLAPGKPAGVEKAQILDDTGWWIVGGVAAIAVIVAVASSSGGNSTATSSPTTS